MGGCEMEEEVEGVERRRSLRSQMGWKEEEPAHGHGACTQKEKSTVPPR